MIQIKPVIQLLSNCPYCQTSLRPVDVLWQGIHVCAESECDNCGAEIIEDLPTGQALASPYQVDLKRGAIYGSKGALGWFGKPLLESLEQAQVESKPGFEVKRFSQFRHVIILNCLDYLYGHAVLKLLNVDHHLKSRPDLGLILIIPRFLRWMTPVDIAEVWTVDIPLTKAKNFYPYLNELIQKECSRFDSIYLSPAHSHPREFDIARLTGVQPHNFAARAFRITFVWREESADRLWLDWSKYRALCKLFHKFKLERFLLRWQNYKIKSLFSHLRTKFPEASFTLAGAGKSTRFPDWIDDQRTVKFSPEIERHLCQVYAESRLVIGVHGSNMLLPSAHAGLVMDLMPADRWGNFAQDLLYDQSANLREDNRITAFKYRYIPVESRPKTLTKIIISMINDFEAISKIYSFR